MANKLIGKLKGIINEKEMTFAQKGGNTDGV